MSNPRTNIRIDGFDNNREIAITKHGMEVLADAPDLHRWRAWWGSGPMTEDWRGGCGISLQAYPVIRKTREGVWIADNAYWSHDNWQNLSHTRMVMNNSRAAWAKPTQEEAIRSLAVRLARWADHISGSVYRIKSAAATMQKLRPDLFEASSILDVGPEEWRA